MVKIMDYRATTGFYGVRLYLSHKPDFVIQKYYSFKKNGVIVSKKERELIYMQALADEAELIKDNKLTMRTGAFRKSNIQREGIPPQPIRLAGVNVTLQRERKEKNIHIDWEDRGNDIKFHTYPPVIVVHRGKHSALNFRFPFRNKAQFKQAYTQAFVAFIQEYGLTKQEQSLAAEKTPDWVEVRQYIIAEAHRVYTPDQLDFYLSETHISREYG